MQVFLKFFNLFFVLLILIVLFYFCKMKFEKKLKNFTKIIL